MKFEKDLQGDIRTDENLNSNSYSKRKKNRRVRIAVRILGYMVMLTLFVYVILLQRAFARDEMNAQVEQAVSQAMFEAEGQRVQAVSDARTEVLEELRSGLERGDASTVEVLRPFYPDHIVVVSEGKYHFVPIDRTLRLNDYDTANLKILESGEYQYTDGDKVISHKGIDVSRFQGEIDWKEVASDGVEFAIIRAANRGYGTGKIVEDQFFEENMKGALEAGIHPAVYIYTQAVNEDEIREEAELMIKMLEPFDVKCPIVFDVEKTADSSGRMNQLSVEERTELTILFCETIREAGYKPIIYHNMEMAAVLLEIDRLEDYDKWFAYYQRNMYYPYQYRIWQYSDKGNVKGISGNVDLNISFDAFWEE